MGFLGDLFGSKVNVPKYTPVDVAKSQSSAIAGNLAALPQAEELATKTTAFNQEAIRKLLEQAIPGFSGITGNIAKNIADLTAGKIPTDVSEQVQLSDAASALAGGYAGSGAHGNLVARDLGITSLQLTKQGLSAAESWIQMMDQMFAPGQFNVSSMFLTPQFTAQSDIEQQQFGWQAALAKAKADAAPDPITEGLVSGGMSLFSGKGGGFLGNLFSDVTGLKPFGAGSGFLGFGQTG